MSKLLEIREDNYFLKVFPYLDRDRFELIKDIKKLTRYLLLCSESFSTLGNKYILFYKFLQMNISKQIDLLKVSNSRFTERQSGLACGRHALNNLLGHEKFIIGPNIDKRIDFQSFKDLSGQIDIRSLCYQFTERIKSIEKDLELENLPNILGCETVENYDINTLSIALNLVGYKTEQMWGSEFKIIYERANNWKIIINKNGFHWTCAKKQDNNYIYIDSVGPTYLEYKTFDEIKTNISDKNKIIFCHFIGEILDPIEDYISFHFIDIPKLEDEFIQILE